MEASHMQQSIQIPQDLYDEVDKQAKAQRKTAEDLVVEWVSEKVGKTEIAETKEAIEQEIAAFKALKPKLLEEKKN